MYLKGRYEKIRSFIPILTIFKEFCTRGISSKIKSFGREFRKVRTEIKKRIIGANHFVCPNNDLISFLFFMPPPKVQYYRQKKSAPKDALKIQQ